MAEFNVCDTCPRRGVCFDLLEQVQKRTDDVAKLAVELSTKVFDPEECDGSGWGLIHSNIIGGAIVSQTYGVRCENPNSEAVEDILGSISGKSIKVTS